jgi:predicted  nucleic acid-binding Zn-ribbon protein
MQDVTQNTCARGLLGLQRLDLEVAQLREESRKIHEQWDQAREEYREQAQDVSRQAEELRSREEALSSLEATSTKLREERQQFQVKTALIRKNDEYQVALATLADFDHRIAENEESQLSALSAVEESRGEQRELRKALTRAEAQLADLRDRLKLQEGALQNKIEQLLSGRPAQERLVEPGTLQAYERLRTGARENPLRPWAVKIEKGACGRCHRVLPPQKAQEVRRGKTLQSCDSCGALLCDVEE